MNIQEFKSANKKVLDILKDFSLATKDFENIVILGSISLVSHTQSLGYYRKIKDIDTIVDIKYKEEIEKYLFNLGYIKSTFIKYKIPFLSKYIENKYARYNNSNMIDLEILYTSFKYRDGYLEVELFKNIIARINIVELQTKNLSGIDVKTVSPRTLYAIRMLVNKIFGRIFIKGKEKRKIDNENLLKCFDRTNEDSYKDLVHVRIGSI